MFLDKRVLELILKSTTLMETNPWLVEQKSVVYVMLYDLLIGPKQTIRGGGRYYFLIFDF